MVWGGWVMTSRDVEPKNVQGVGGVGHETQGCCAKKLFKGWGGSWWSGLGQHGSW